MSRKGEKRDLIRFQCEKELTQALIQALIRFVSQREKYDTHTRYYFRMSREEMDVVWWLTVVVVNDRI